VIAPAPPVRGSVVGLAGVGASGRSNVPASPCSILETTPVRFGAAVPASRCTEHSAPQSTLFPVTVPEPLPSFATARSTCAVGVPDNNTPSAGLIVRPGGRAAHGNRDHENHGLTAWRLPERMACDCTITIANNRFYTLLFGYYNSYIVE